MEFFSTLIRFFQNGGAFMYPILVVLILGLSIIIERYIYLTRARRETRRLWSDLMPLINDGRIADAQDLAMASDTAIGRVLGYGIARARASNASREEIELAMEEALMEVTPQLERRTHYLATFSNAATLLGLLESVGLTEDPAFAKIGPYLRSITTIEGGGHALTGEVERYKLVIGLRPAGG